MTGLRVASDVGGTFTDNLAYDEATKTVTVAKVPTTPENRALGTVRGLMRALELQGRSGGDVGYVGHGMTTATNAVIQRTGGRTAFITNEGFRDLLLIGRQNRPSLYDIRKTRPEPLVRREDCHTVRGRLDRDGNEVTPLDEAGLCDIATRLAADRVDAVAVCLLHAYANPDHERRAKAILSQRLPGIPVCISTDILAEFREYERASTVVLNAFLLPVMDRYLASLTDLLADPKEGLGLARDVPVMIMETSGGLMTVASAREKPVHTVLSGPAGGVVASAHIAALSGFADIITLDMGGTSTDISLVLEGRPQVTREASLEGTPIRIPVIDINAIGAGGGSIAWIDDGGALRVGPRSAEAVPGPACYGRGGIEPTVTDANLVLGRLGGDSRLGGELALDVDAAAHAIAERIGGPLGLDLVEAASGILRVANATMARGVRVVSVERGHDPRRLALVPFGGAGPMHGSPLARDLGIPRLLVPPTPGILCALGMLVADLRHDLVQTRLGAHADLSPQEVAAIFEPMLAEARRLLTEDRVAPERWLIEMRLEMRYIGQSYELPIPLAGHGAADLAALTPAFHAEHARRFGHSDAAAPIEVVSFAVTATGLIDTPELPRPPQGVAQPPAAARRGTRRAFFEGAGGGWHECPVWQREALLAGNELAGPALVEEISATTVLYPGDHARVDAIGSLVVDIG
ncbi:MAG TPA: hydantoinase/oxoprolinase family protein [Stellaceae bacterium]|jgi:N-methylhydantoinase A|nr:hydantoinase/oxoprolinase family protein [Stellaceae bacterium]